MSLRLKNFHFFSKLSIYLSNSSREKLVQAATPATIPATLAKSSVYPTRGVMSGIKSKGKIIYPIAPIISAFR